MFKLWASWEIRLDHKSRPFCLLTVLQGGRELGEPSPSVFFFTLCLSFIFQMALGSGGRGRRGVKKVVESYKGIPNRAIAIVKLPVEMKNCYVRVQGPSCMLINYYIA